VIGTRVVTWDRWKDVVIDAAGVVAKHGVEPVSIPDMLGLVGDDADGIPGLQGWGKSSAGKVLMAWKHIEAIPDDHATWNVAVRGADKLALTLRAHRTEAMLYKKLATLRLDCPIACDADAIAWRGVDAAALSAFCVELGMAPDAIRV
jgi:5'-3' exonuclease